MVYLRNKILGENTYPYQFWLLFWGMLITRAGTSMMWPFVTIYIRTRLDVPLTTAALMLSIQAIAGLLSTLVISLIMDRYGRKLPMALSLIGWAIVLVLMTVTDQIEVWAILMFFYGAMTPIFSNGVNTMTADLIEPAKRSSAYALMRMVSNAGIAIGPVVGGILAQISFELIFLVIAGIFVLMAGLTLSFISETAPKTKAKNDEVSSGK